MDQEVAKLVSRFIHTFGLAILGSAVASPACVGMEILLRVVGLFSGSPPTVSFLDWFALSAPVVIVVGCVSAMAALGLVLLTRRESLLSLAASLFGVGGLAFSALLALPRIDPQPADVIAGYLVSLPIWVAVLILSRVFRWQVYDL